MKHQRKSHYRVTPSVLAFRLLHTTIIAVGSNAIGEFVTDLPAKSGGPSCWWQTPTDEAARERELERRREIDRWSKS